MAWANRTALLKRVGHRRITSAEDFEDGWGYRISYLFQPRHVLVAVGLAMGILLIVTAGLWLTGFRVVSQSRAQLADLAETAVLDAGNLSAAELRVRVAGAARALEFVDRAITGSPPQHAGTEWHVRLFGRRSPEVEPGRVAVLLTLIDKINSYPLADQQGMIERIVLTAGGEANTWAILKVLADLPNDVRKLLLAADAAQLKEVIAWLRQRPRLEVEPSSLLAAITHQKEEIADVTQAGRARVKAMTEELERLRGKSSACRRHVDDFDRCLNASAQPRR